MNFSAAGLSVHGSVPNAVSTNVDLKRENLQADGADPTRDSNGCERNGSLKRQQDGHSAERPSKKCRTESEPPMHAEMDSSEVNENWTADAGYIQTPCPHCSGLFRGSRIELLEQDRVRPPSVLKWTLPRCICWCGTDSDFPVYAIMDSSEITEHFGAEQILAPPSVLK